MQLKSIKLASRELYLIAEFFQGGLQYSALITLNLYLSIFHGATHSTLLFQRFSQCLQCFGREWHAADDSNRLAAPPLGFTSQANNAITGRRRSVLAANTVAHRSMTLRAQAAPLGGVDETGFITVALAHRGCH